MDYASAIRQQAEDLKDELKELNSWQEEVARQEEANKKRKAYSMNADMIPPVRGTVPSLKEAILKANGKNSREDPVKNAKEEGNTLFQASKFKEAITAYGTGIDLDPEGAMAYVLYGNRALCYLKLERWEDAERDASVCVRLNRSYSKGYFRRAMARKQLGKLKEARTDLEAVLALSPNDASATSEMKTITEMLKFERERNAAPVVSKKKVIIAEVDDEDEEEYVNEGKEENSKERTISTNAGKNNAEMLELERKERFQKEMHELERAREAQRQIQESRAKEAEAKLSQKRRISARVEVIEEEPFAVQNEVSASVAGGEEKQEKKEVPVSPNANESKVTPPSKTTENERKKENIVPRTFKAATSRYSKETLRAPKSFTEFERVFSDIRGNDELCCYYISLIPPATLRSLFGNNMTPDILLGLLSTVKLLPGNVAIAFVQGLCSVKRVEDISLFFDPSEKRVASEVLDVIRSCGASEEDMKLFRERLRLA